MLNCIFIHSLRPSTTRYQTGTQFHALTSAVRKPGSSLSLTICCFIHFIGMNRICGSYVATEWRPVFVFIFASLRALTTLDVVFKRSRPARLNGSWVSLIWSIATPKMRCKRNFTLYHGNVHSGPQRSFAFLAISSHDAISRFLLFLNHALHSGEKG